MVLEDQEEEEEGKEAGCAGGGGESVGPAVLARRTELGEAGVGHLSTLGARRTGWQDERGKAAGRLWTASSAQ